MTTINKDNIVEVLEYNGIDIDVRIGMSFSGTSRIYIRHESISRDIFSCDLDRNWLEALEAFLGRKLKPISESELPEYKKVSVHKTEEDDYHFKFCDQIIAGFTRQALFELSIEIQKVLSDIE